MDRVRSFRGPAHFVAPHYKTVPDKTKNNNYSARGNTNPMTGKKGSKPRDDEVPPKQL